MQSKRPELQNVPLRTDLGRALRRRFARDAVFIDVAYDAIEMRIAAMWLLEKNE